jgi:hypothetical protein
MTDDRPAQLEPKWMTFAEAASYLPCNQITGKPQLRNMLYAVSNNK